MRTLCFFLIVLDYVNIERFLLIELFSYCKECIELYIKNWKHQDLLSNFSVNLFFFLFYFFLCCLRRVVVVRIQRRKISRTKEIFFIKLKLMSTNRKRQKTKKNTNRKRQKQKKKKRMGTLIGDYQGFAFIFAIGLKAWNSVLWEDNNCCSCHFCLKRTTNFHKIRLRTTAGNIHLSDIHYYSC